MEKIGKVFVRCYCLQSRSYNKTAWLQAYIFSDFEKCTSLEKIWRNSLTRNTVKPRPEAHMDMILFEVFLKNIHLIPQDQIVQ